jgi:hypothetical protein
MCSCPLANIKLLLWIDEILGELEGRPRVSPFISIKIGTSEIGRRDLVFRTSRFLEIPLG